MPSKKIEIKISIRDDGGCFAGSMNVDTIQGGVKDNNFDFSSLPGVSKSKTIEDAAAQAGKIVEEYFKALLQ